LENRSFVVFTLILSFCIIFGTAGIVSCNSFKKATEATIRSNETRAILLAKLILEHQRAALGVLRSYRSRSLLMDSVKRMDFEGAVRHLTDLVEKNPEAEWPFIADPDGVLWVNFPVDKKRWNKDLSQRDWYKGVSREWKPYVSSVFKMLVGEKDLAVAVSAPTFDEKGKVIGILNTAQSMAPVPFDIIFCRNVAIYFTEPDKVRRFKNIGKYLAKDGRLIIGGARNRSADSAPSSSPSAIYGRCFIN